MDKNDRFEYKVINWDDEVNDNVNYHGKETLSKNDSSKNDRCKILKMPTRSYKASKLGLYDKESSKIANNDNKHFEGSPRLSRFERKKEVVNVIDNEFLQKLFLGYEIVSVWYIKDGQEEGSICLGNKAKKPTLTCKKYREQNQNAQEIIETKSNNDEVSDDFFVTFNFESAIKVDDIHVRSVTIKWKGEKSALKIQQIEEVKKILDNIRKYTDSPILVEGNGCRC